MEADQGGRHFQRRSLFCDLRAMFSFQVFRPNGNPTALIKELPNEFNKGVPDARVAVMKADQGSHCL
jgi:hypothetical protein